MHRPCKGYAPLLLFLVAIAGAPGNATAAAPAGEVIHEGRFDAAQLRWVAQADGNVAAELPDTRLVPVPGRAMLPNREMLLLVPADRRVAGVVVEPLATSLLKVPGQLALSADVTTSEGGRLGAADVAAALDKRATTGEWVATWSTHLWRGYQLLAVAVTPLRPLAGDAGACEFLSDYAVRVVWADGGAPAAAPDEEGQHEIAGEHEGADGDEQVRQHRVDAGAVAAREIRHPGAGAVHDRADADAGEHQGDEQSFSGRARSQGHGPP